MNTEMSSTIFGLLCGTVVSLFLLNILSNRWVKRESAKAYSKGFALGAGIKSISDSMLSDPNTESKSEVI